MNEGDDRGLQVRGQSQALVVEANHAHHLQQGEIIKLMCMKQVVRWEACEHVCLLICLLMCLLICLLMCLLICLLMCLLMCLICLGAQVSHWQLLRLRDALWAGLPDITQWW